MDNQERISRFTKMVEADPITGKPFNASALPQAMERYFDGTGKRSTLAKTVAHDLRRTMRSHLTKLGVLPHVAEDMLNHAKDPLVATYDLADGLEQRREAMRLWNDRLSLIVNPRANVVALSA